MKTRKANSKKEARINVRLPHHLEYWLGKASDDMNIGRAELMRCVIANFLDIEDQDQAQYEIVKSITADANLDVHYQLEMIKQNKQQEID